MDPSRVFAAAPGCRLHVDADKTISNTTANLMEMAEALTKDNCVNTIKTRWLSARSRIVCFPGLERTLVDRRFYYRKESTDRSQAAAVERRTGISTRSGGGSFVPREPGRNMENFKQSFVWQSAGKLKPIVPPRHTLGGVGQALRDMLDRKITDKIVLVP